MGQCSVGIKVEVDAMFAVRKFLEKSCYVLCSENTFNLSKSAPEQCNKDCIIFNYVDFKQ